MFQVEPDAFTSHQCRCKAFWVLVIILFSSAVDFFAGGSISGGQRDVAWMRCTWTGLLFVVGIFTSDSAFSTIQKDLLCVT